MAQLFGQLSFVSAVLAGFAFTFVSGLLSSSSRSRAYPWVFAGALSAALSLMVASVGSVFGGLGVEGEYLNAAQSQDLLALISQAFLVGIFSLVFASGCSGWLRSKRLGWLSTFLSLLGAYVLGSVILPFVRLS